MNASIPTISIVDEVTTSSNDVHSMNALSPNGSNEGGTMIFFNDMHFSYAFGPIFVTISGIEMSINEEQFLNANAAMITNNEGESNLTVFNDTQFSKVKQQMCVTVEGIVICVSEVQLKNNLFEIFCIIQLNLKMEKTK